MNNPNACYNVTLTCFFFSYGRYNLYKKRIFYKNVLVKSNEIIQERKLFKKDKTTDYLLQNRNGILHINILDYMTEGKEFS